MSWLLVALVPGLLMLTAFGLDRLEASLTSEHTPTRRTVDSLQHKLQARRLAIATILGDANDERLPTRLNGSPVTNPEFQETRYANRV